MNNADETVRALYLCAAGGQTVLQAAEWCTKAANLIESLQADAASYRQVKNALQREGFDDIEAMISRYKQVMYDANEIDIERDERIESLQADLARVTAERDAAVAERDALMRRHSKQVETIRRRIDAGGITEEESRLLDDLMFETRYDRRGVQAGEDCK